MLVCPIVSGYLEFRPLLDPRTGSIFALEAVPVRVSGAAQSNPLVDRWMLYKAQRAKEAMRAHAIDVPLWVRLHTETVEREPQIAVLLWEADAALPGTIVEISSASEIATPKRVEKFIADCHTIDLKVALNDYGKGHQSNIALRALQPDFLKIDSFHSRGLAKSMHAQSIVNMLIELARAERIGVVVEGVDGIGSWEWLRLNRCTGVEAPFITPSMSLEDALQWLPLWQYRVANAQAAGQTVGAMLAEFQMERLPDFPAAGATFAPAPLR